MIYNNPDETKLKNLFLPNKRCNLTFKDDIIKFFRELMDLSNLILSIWSDSYIYLNTDSVCIWQWDNAAAAYWNTVILHKLHD